MDLQLRIPSEGTRRRPACGRAVQQAGPPPAGLVLAGCSQPRGTHRTRQSFSFVFEPQETAGRPRGPQCRGPSREAQGGHCNDGGPTRRSRFRAVAARQSLVSPVTSPYASTMPVAAALRAKASNGSACSRGIHVGRFRRGFRRPGTGQSGARNVGWRMTTARHPARSRAGHSVPMRAGSPSY